MAGEPELFSESTKRGWQKFIPYLAFIGILVAGLGLYFDDPGIVGFGLVLTAIAVVASSIVFFLGNKNY